MNRLTSFAKSNLAADMGTDKTNTDKTNNNAWRLPTAQNSLAEGAFYASLSASPQPHSPSAIQADGDNTGDTHLNAHFKGLTGSDRGSDMSNSSCDVIAAKLSAYQDGELDVEETHKVSLHLGDCVRCGTILASIQDMDLHLEREWRDTAPLPFSLRFEQSIDSVMRSLPSLPARDIAFAQRRVHARTRWMRFAAGMAGMLLIIASLWSSYQIGYDHGRRSVTALASKYQPLPTPTMHFGRTKFLSVPRLAPASLHSSYRPPLRLDIQSVTQPGVPPIVQPSTQSVLQPIRYSALVKTSVSPAPPHLLKDIGYGIHLISN